MTENDNLYFKPFEGLYGIFLESRGGTSGTSNERNSSYKENLDYLIEHLYEVNAEDIQFFLAAKRTKLNTFTDLSSRLIDIEDQKWFIYKDLRDQDFRKKLNKKIRVTGTVDPIKANNSTRSLFVTFKNSQSSQVKSFLDKKVATSDLEYVYQKVKKRLRQSKFRKELLEAYDNTCAITGCKVKDILEAAHIEPYNGAHTSIVSNGILLRSDIHDLFDLYIDDERLINISLDFKIEIHSSLKDSEYWQYNGEKIRLPIDEQNHPHFNVNVNG